MTPTERRPRDGAIIFGDLIGKSDLLSTLLPTLSATWFLSPLSGAALDDLKDLRRRKSHALSAHELNFLADGEFVRCPFDILRPVRCFGGNEMTRRFCTNTHDRCPSASWRAHRLILSSFCRGQTAAAAAVLGAL